MIDLCGLPLLVCFDQDTKKRKFTFNTFLFKRQLNGKCVKKQMGFVDVGNYWPTQWSFADPEYKRERGVQKKAKT